MKKPVNQKKTTSFLLTKDLQLFRFIQLQVKCRLLDILMPQITKFGGAVFVSLVTLSFLLSTSSLYYQLGLKLLFSLGSSHLMVQLLKHLTNRLRPYEQFKELDLNPSVLGTYSFPSGHSTAAFCLAQMLAFYFPAGSLIFFLLASLVAGSRVYLGVHYPLDVVIGAGIGISFAYLIY